MPDSAELSARGALRDAMTLRKPWLAAAALVAAVLGGCATLDSKQREWIFQPSVASWGNLTADDMSERWIDFQSEEAGERVRLHALWAPAAGETADGPPRSAAAAAALPDGEAPAVPLAQRSAPPVLLYLHGARWNVVGSAPRIRRMQELGFSVLAIDYRGFGKSSQGLPSEVSAGEDARAAWEWLAREFPGRPRYLMGHSLGGAIAIDVAARVGDERGTIVDSTFTNIPDVVSSFKWGWLPVGWLITQRFDSVDKVRRIGAPLLVVHGTDDRLIPQALGRRLYEAAAAPKRFVSVEGGSHHSTQQMGMAQVRNAVRDLFGVGAGI